MKTRVRAVIMANHSVLLIHRIKKGEEYWVFPGGGVEQGESLEEALKREALEEMGVEVEVLDRFMEQRLTFEGQEPQLEVFFNCFVTGGELGTGKGPEFQLGTAYEGMYTLEWVPLVELSRRKVLPEAVKAQLQAEGSVK